MSERTGAAREAVPLQGSNMPDVGFNLGGIWAMLAPVVGMVAIGFVAVWSVLSNALCTLIILVDRPFEVGDELEFAGEPVQGKVADLNFIYTTLRAADGSCLQIPNNLFLQKATRGQRANAAPRRFVSEGAGQRPHDGTGRASRLAPAV
jgi:hypothetical protein